GFRAGGAADRDQRKLRMRLGGEDLPRTRPGCVDGDRVEAEQRGDPLDAVARIVFDRGAQPSRQPAPVDATGLVQRLDQRTATLVEVDDAFEDRARAVGRFAALELAEPVMAVKL